MAVAAEPAAFIRFPYASHGNNDVSSDSSVIRQEGNSSTSRREHNLLPVSDTNDFCNHWKNKVQTCSGAVPTQIAKLPIYRKLN